MSLESYLTPETGFFSIISILLTLILRIVMLYFKKFCVIVDKVEILEYVASITHPELLKKFRDNKK